MKLCVFVVVAFAAVSAAAFAPRVTEIASMKAIETLKQNTSEATV